MKTDDFGTKKAEASNLLSPAIFMAFKFEFVEERTRFTFSLRRKSKQKETFINKLKFESYSNSYTYD